MQKDLYKICEDQSLPPILNQRDGYAAESTKFLSIVYMGFGIDTTFSCCRTLEACEFNAKRCAVHSARERERGDELGERSREPEPDFGYQSGLEGRI
jgi:hypothetical protein